MRLRKFNNILSAIVILLGLYIALSPFIPQFLYLLKDSSPESLAPYSGQLASIEGSKATNAVPKDNRLVIPSIKLNEPIIESDYISAIKDGGTWRRPNSSTPNIDSNTVIIAHRFYGNNVSTFYNLDKVQVGEPLAVYWEGEEIIYQVTEIKVVSAGFIDIEAPTTDKRLTLYTCHPLWTSKNRLVVVAKPVESIN